MTTAMPATAPATAPIAAHRTALSVNVNKVALVRNTRHLGIPSVTRAALLCLQAGAQGITVHPRPDERHIRAHDVTELAALLQDWPGREYNIEGTPFHNLMDFIRAVRPHQATFVPDGGGQFTSDHGWCFPQGAERLAPLIAACKALGVRVSLIMPTYAMLNGDETGEFYEPTDDNGEPLPPYTSDVSEVLQETRKYLANRGHIRAVR